MYNKCRRRDADHVPENKSSRSSLLRPSFGSRWLHESPCQTTPHNPPCCTGHLRPCTPPTWRPGNHSTIPSACCPCATLQVPTSDRLANGLLICAPALQQALQQPRAPTRGVISANSQPSPFSGVGSWAARLTSLGHTPSDLLVHVLNSQHRLPSISCRRS